MQPAWMFETWKIRPNKVVKYIYNMYKKVLKIQKPFCSTQQVRCNCRNASCEIVNVSYFSCGVTSHDVTRKLIFFPNMKRWRNKDTKVTNTSPLCWCENRITRSDNACDRLHTLLLCVERGSSVNSCGPIKSLTLQDTKQQCRNTM